ncbi:MFS transporter [Ahrensia sp. 13_GOM-1096m]|uniref:MFS transporter n=1 Tax=Ahrensia sp. 13_GOM-1096m TaxID=1380380 RepID=UPI000687D63D|nr:MFS transporter [Ahrensia sp. 13_GOM-1096m]
MSEHQTTAFSPSTAGALFHARWAVNAAFFANGLMIGHWAAKIPVMVERLGISEGMLGQLIVVFGLGALFALIVGAWLVTKYGSVFVIRWTWLFLSISLILLTLVPSLFGTALALLWFGMFLGAMDNAMNANGVAVEVALDRPVMSSYHGFWSLGGLVGGLSGGAMIVWFGEMGHALIVTGIVLALMFYAWPRLMSDANMDSDFDAQQEAGAQTKKRKTGIPRSFGLYLLGFAALFSFASEGTIIDWSALYLRNELDAPLIVSGYAVAAFSFTMALMRFLGDGVRTRFGDRRTFIVSAAISSVGLFFGGYADNFYLACFGFFVAGIGMANVVPVLFSAAGKYPGIRPSVGIAVVTALGYAGLLFIPALVGVVAEYYSIGIVYVGWAIIVLGVAALGFVLPHIDGNRTKKT